MKKDILIPEIKGVYVAVVYEHNEIYKVYDWNAYIINDKLEDLEMVLIVTRGYSDTKKTTTFRKKIELLPSKSYTKIEMILDDVLCLNNVFSVTFFKDNTLFEKSFEFRKNTIKKAFIEKVPLLGLKGVLRH